MKESVTLKDHKEYQRTKSYLARIGYSGELTNSLSVLRKLHKRHMTAVPFENLDIHLGRPIVLSEDSLYRKIVRERRGGFCYELNGSFAVLLANLGFDVSLLSGKVAKDNGGFTPEFDHMALLVEIQGARWLADVGFGESFSEPKKIDDDRPQKDPTSPSYRITRSGSSFLMSSKDDGRTWKPQYSFTLRPRQLEEFVPRCQFQQTSPRSHFKKGWLCSRLTRAGRITLTDKKFIFSRNRRRFERPIRTRSEFYSLLKKHFGIRLKTDE
jgi:N-hydroxyarylamine O-acetyltransferase